MTAKWKKELRKKAFKELLENSEIVIEEGKLCLKFNKKKEELK